MPTRPYRGIHPTLEEGVYVDSTALVIGDVVLGKDVSIWPMAVVRGDVNYIRIGARSNVQDNSVLHVTRPYPGSEAGWPLIIGHPRQRSGPCVARAEASRVPPQAGTQPKRRSISFSSSRTTSTQTPTATITRPVVRGNAVVAKRACMNGA